MATQPVTRCKRCATILRKNRTVCPCCGLDINAPEESSAAESAAAAPVEKGAKKVAAKAGVKMCQVCMASVPEEQLVEQEGQKVCPTCFESMRTKAAKKAAPPPEKK